jgi:hypothetical protein
MNEFPASYKVVVSGDPLADWVIAQQDESEPRRTAGPKWQKRQKEVGQQEIPGGARLLAELIEEMKPAAFTLWTDKWDHIDWFEPNISHFYATLTQFPESERVQDFDDPLNFRWRISDDLGISRREVGENPAPQDPNEPDDADLLILADAGLGYYEDHDTPKAINGDGKQPWLIVKTGGDGMLEREDKLQPSLHVRRDKVILVTTADDLRRISGIEIRRGTAWERAAADCVEVFAEERRLNRYRFVVVSFGPAGAFLFDRDKHVGGECSLFYDPVKVEGAPDFWLNGRMWGYTSALTSAIAREVMESIIWQGPPLESSSDEAERRLKRGVKRGLRAMQAVLSTGFGRIAIRAPGAAPGSDLIPQKPSFPLDSVREAIEAADAVVDEDKSIAEASVTGQDLIASAISTNGNSLEDVAKEIVYRGVDKVLAGSNIPYLKYGEIVTVDRREIESFQAVRSLVKEYAEREGTRVRRYWKARKSKMPVPLSIAMFGQPGSGKSTAVRQVIGSLRLQEREFTFKEFNLSQFRSTSELVNSFHLLRDDRLKGKVPVVLWDEFDSNFDGPLGWLRYFLSPMQDGTFQEQQAVHPIGRSVFVFAGGVTPSLNSFKTKIQDEEYKEAKGPDFLSRVRGTMELQGIDKRNDDPFWVVRRAILLRTILDAETSLFKDAPDGRDAIDDGVLDGFLRVDKFSHGVRSMKAIVMNSSLLGERYFSKSSLPNTTQLNLHVDSDEFYRAMGRLP